MGPEKTYEKDLLGTLPYASVMDGRDDIFYLSQPLRSFLLSSLILLLSMNWSELVGTLRKDYNDTIFFRNSGKEGQGTFESFLRWLWFLVMCFFLNLRIGGLLLTYGLPDVKGSLTDFLINPWRCIRAPLSDNFRAYYRSRQCTLCGTRTSFLIN